MNSKLDFWSPCQVQYRLAACPSVRPLEKSVSRFLSCPLPFAVNLFLSSYSHLCVYLRHLFPLLLRFNPQFLIISFTCANLCNNNWHPILLFSFGFSKMCKPPFNINLILNDALFQLENYTKKTSKNKTFKYRSNNLILYEFLFICIYIYL